MFVYFVKYFFFLLFGYMNCIVNYFNIRYNYYNRRDKMVSVLTEKELKNLNYYWMATNYLSALFMG